MKRVEDRFLEYIKIDTTSDPKSETKPSTEIQFDLGKMLKLELENLGLKNVELDENCNLYGLLPSNLNYEVPKLGLIAHMDTSPDMKGYNIKPRIVEDYDGKDIELNEDTILSPETFPELKDHIGMNLIVTDGTTLLGADDKAGIAEIISAIEYYVKNPELPHGDVYVAFTPDEEIGRGMDTFNLEKFPADFAYTIDGGECGQIQYENFNAASAEITIKGRNVHPGSSKNKMINSLSLGIELDFLLPSNEKPQFTEKYEGFFHLNEMVGNVEKCQMQYIIRDHDKELFQKKKDLMKSAVEFLNNKYGDVVELELKDSYYNMKEKVEPKMEIIDLVTKSMKELDIEPIIEPIRGGTDGAVLSYMGVPCPNIFTGGMNAHGKYEYISIENMEKARDLVIKIIENVGKK